MSDLTVARHLAVVPVSAELRDDGGHPPGAVERVVSMLRRSRAARQQAETDARVSIWLTRARLAVGKPASAVLDLHSPDGEGNCIGCGTWCSECGDEPWPCASVIVLAKAAGLDLPEC